MIIRQFEISDLSLFSEPIPENLIAYIDVSTTWTVVNDVKILGCGGFRKYWPGVYEVWIMPSSYEDFKRYKIRLIKYIKEKLDEISWHRVQATIAVSSERDEKFIEFLGFKLDAYLEKYGMNKEDYFLYAMVK